MVSTKRKYPLNRRMKNISVAAIPTLEDLTTVYKISSPTKGLRLGSNPIQRLKAPMISSQLAYLASERYPQSWMKRRSNDRGNGIFSINHISLSKALLNITGMIRQTDYFDSLDSRLKEAKPKIGMTVIPMLLLSKAYRMFASTILELAPSSGCDA